MKRMIRTPLVRLVDDDDAFRESQREFLKAMGWQSRTMRVRPTFSSATTSRGRAASCSTSACPA